MNSKESIADPYQLSDQKRLTAPLTQFAPTIDGIINTDEWRDASTISDLHQFEPVDHGTASEDSVFRIKYDADFLYIGARLADSDPARIVARQLIQGKSLQSDDAIEIILDPFNNGRSGYNFQVNPNGIRREAIYENTTGLNRDWETIWFAEARITDDGWETEIAIPFKSINFDPDKTTWGLGVTRTIARKKEEIAWTSFGRQSNPSTTGSMLGMEGARQGLGLDLVPSLSLKSLDTNTGSGRETEFVPSLDAFFKFTPSLTGVLSLNTDFAATEVDDQQINLTRFSLFLPEKRDFFLQDADIFGFGGLEQENGIPFFSRRIGLGGNGEPLDITAGGKLTGRIGRLNIGLLSVLQEHAVKSADENVFVGRISYNILEESSVGVIFTDGNPIGEEANRVLGLDFRYRSKDLIANADLVFDSWFQQSDTDSVFDEDRAWGMRLDLQKQEGLRGELLFKHIEENFQPALGFVNRSGIDEAEATIAYGKWFYNSWFRKFIPGASLKEISDMDGVLESREVVLRPLHLIGNHGDEFRVKIFKNREVVDSAFDLVPGVSVEPGDYSFDRTEVRIETAQERKLAANGEITWGDFFDGDLLSIEAGLDWRPNRNLHLGAEYEFIDGKMPSGAFVARLVSMRANIAFNAHWSWTNFIQYENVGETAGLNSRLRWNRRAGQDLFFVVNQGFDRDADRDFVATASEITLKMSYTIRF